MAVSLLIAAKPQLIERAPSPVALVLSPCAVLLSSVHLFISHNFPHSSAAPYTLL
jgi:hypothetical protein